MESNLLFALDIGTRSVVGLVGQRQSDNCIRLLASEREEHHTRAMLDGQIHDVPEVAEVLISIKTKLEQTVGPLQKVAVAAAGRALCTMRVTAEIDTSTRNALTSEDERALELAAVQLAQKDLASSDKVSDPSSYYCIGYSVVSFSLDGHRLKSLVGQYGSLASIDAIATFLPRQVIDSLQSAVKAADLALDTITLEPIAAINVLIPSTMRHLNLALVDIGAGTSDVAITRDGSVIAYGMVPFAGDEITEALSHKYLLDFNVAETIKRQLNNKNKKISFNDVLGMSHKIAVKEFLDSISSRVNELAQAIAGEILSLNVEPPQAVILVGGGSMTPLLPEFLAEALNIPLNRVGVRLPNTIKDIVNIPESLCAADAVTPLGILKISGSRNLSFLNITVNDRSFRLFNIVDLTVSNALLTAGIDARTLRGRPGMGITISVNGQTHFIPGGHGTPGKITVNGKEANLSDAIADGDSILVIQGSDGETPSPVLEKTVSVPPPLSIKVNGVLYEIPQAILINGNPAEPGVILKDRDKVKFPNNFPLGEMLTKIGKEPVAVQYVYTVNGTKRTFNISPEYKVNNKIVGLDYKLSKDDIVEISGVSPLNAAGILGLAPKDTNESITVYVNDKPCQVPLSRHVVFADKSPVSMHKPLPNNTSIEYSYNADFFPILSDVLLASGFDARSLSPGTTVDIFLNGKSAEYTARMKEGDKVGIKVTPPETA